MLLACVKHGVPPGERALLQHKHYIAEHGEDSPEINGWKWGQRGPAAKRGSSTESDNV